MRIRLLCFYADSRKRVKNGQQAEIKHKQRRIHEDSDFDSLSRFRAEAAEPERTTKISIVKPKNESDLLFQNFPNVSYTFRYSKQRANAI